MLSKNISQAIFKCETVKLKYRLRSTCDWNTITTALPQNIISSKLLLVVLNLNYNWKLKKTERKIKLEDIFYNPKDFGVFFDRTY